MISSADRWALTGNLWILVAISSLSMFMFIIVYLYILYPEESFALQSSAPAAAAAVPSSKIISADGELSSEGGSQQNDLSRFIQRVIGHGKVGGANGDTNTKLRPFRSLGFLLVTLPSAYLMYRNKMREETVST